MSQEDLFPSVLRFKAPERAIRSVTLLGDVNGVFAAIFVPRLPQSKAQWGPVNTASVLLAPAVYLNAVPPLSFYAPRRTPFNNSPSS